MRSDRLYFREFGEADFSLFYSIFSNEAIMKYALMDKADSEEDLVPYFQNILKNNGTTDNRSVFEYAVFDQTGRRFIGFADAGIVKKNGDGGSAEIGYFLHPEFWGQGYATEIANCLIKFCFDQLGVHRVFARCNANNANSEKVMIKTGMKREGEFRKVRYKNGGWDNELQYSILVEEWNQSLAFKGVLE